MDRSEKVGRWFVPLRGPFQGFAGQFVESYDDRSALLLFNLFGRESSARIPREDLGDGGGEAAGVREPRKPSPTSDEMAATNEDE